MTEPVPVRRIEVFTGAGQRRAWSAEDKARIVAESYSGLESVCAVARRYGLAQGQLFTWRREARKALSRVELSFAPVVIEPAPPASPVAPTQPHTKRPRRRSRRGGGIELEIDGVVVRVERGADAKTVAAVISALKATVTLVPGAPGSQVRVMVATKPVDFRKGMDGLAALVKEQLRADPFSGVVYVFRAKRADRVKLIWWDGTGLSLLA